jgi:putative transposase
VSSGFISKWTALYAELGVSGLRLKPKGSVGYLSSEQRQAVLTWLQTKEYWNLPELQAHIQDEYQIVFDSKQSYYTLFKDAGMSWKNFQKRNPKADPELAQKRVGNHGLARLSGEIESGELVVFFQDECHLLWGDLCGYI